MAITTITASSPGQAGWTLGTKNHPYEHLLGNAEEKENRAVSGTSRGASNPARALRLPSRPSATDFSLFSRR